MRRKAKGGRGCLLQSPPLGPSAYRLSPTAFRLPPTAFRLPPTALRLAPPMNIEQARFNMIEQQIRPWEVLDPTVLDLLFEVKREEFVPEAHRSLAFADMEIPLGHG